MGIKMKILLAVEESKLSQYVFSYVCDKLMKPDDELLLLVVAEEPYLYVPGPMGSHEAAVQLAIAIQEQKREVARAYRKKLNDKGINNTCLLHKGSIGECIVEESNYRKADLIVIGRRHLGAIERTLTSSSSSYVVHNAKCSVLVVKEESLPDEKQSAERQPLETVE